MGDSWTFYTCYFWTMYTQEQINERFLGRSIANAYNLHSDYELNPPDFFSSCTAKETKQDAQKRHVENTALVDAAVSEMEKSGSEIEQNSAEWIRTKEIKFFVGTQTHDTEVRGPKMLNDPDDLAYFGAEADEDQFQNPHADYDENNMKDFDKCIPRNKGTEGISGDGYFAILDPIRKNRSKDSIKETIVHEVQHLADRHNDSDLAGDKDNVNEAWHAYKSEFRSYWQSGTYDQHSPTKEYENTGFNERQWEIYMQLFLEYGYVEKYKEETVTKSENEADHGKTMNALIASYASPEGVNLKNSLRIENFIDALMECDPSKDPQSPEAKELIESTKLLNEDERESVFHDANMKSIKEKLQNEVHPEVYKEVFTILSGIVF